MGFDTNGIKLLLHARQLDVNFRKVLTIGRQILFLKEKELSHMLGQAGLMEAYKKGALSGKQSCGTISQPAGSRSHRFPGCLGLRRGDPHS